MSSARRPSVSTRAFRGGSSLASVWQRCSLRTTIRSVAKFCCGLGKSTHPPCSSASWATCENADWIRFLRSSCTCHSKGPTSQLRWIFSFTLQEILSRSWGRYVPFWRSWIRACHSRMSSTVERIVADSVASRRFTTILLASLAGLALALALIGIYGVQAYSVARRRSELGIRLALGATGASIVRLVARQAMVPALVGLVIGWIGSLALSRFLSSLVFEITTTDAVAFGTAGSVVVGTALIACYVPARRATEVDPAETLRAD